MFDIEMLDVKQEVEQERRSPAKSQQGVNDWSQGQVCRLADTVIQVICRNSAMNCAAVMSAVCCLVTRLNY